jgi:hypothetical protein
MAAAKGNKYTEKRKVNPQYTEAQIAKLCEELLDYAENDKSIFFASFCRRKGHGRPWLAKLCDHHPKLKEAYAEAKALMAEKVGNLSFYDKTVNAYVGMKYLGVYDSEYRDYQKWLAEISKEQPMREQAKGLFNEWKEDQLKNSEEC